MRRFRVRLLVPIDITVECLTPAVALNRARDALRFAREDMARDLRQVGAYSAVVGSHVEPDVAQVEPAYEPATAGGDL